MPQKRKPCEGCARRKAALKRVGQTLAGRVKKAVKRA
jgi:hypothetical protein